MGMSSYWKRVPDAEYRFQHHSEMLESLELDNGRPKFRVGREQAPRHSSR